MTDIFDDIVIPAEGQRLKAYDDATGLPIEPGTTVKGHITIGIGRALDTHGISQDEANYLFQNDKKAVYAALTTTLSWFSSLDTIRQAVLASMAFQLGLRGLMEFKNFLALMESGDYSGASANVLESKWAEQDPRRAKLLSEVIKTGTIPSITT